MTFDIKTLVEYTNTGISFEYKDCDCYATSDTNLTYEQKKIALENPLCCCSCIYSHDKTKFSTGWLWWRKKYEFNLICDIYVVEGKSLPGGHITVKIHSRDVDAVKCIGELPKEQLENVLEQFRIK